MATNVRPVHLNVSLIAALEPQSQPTQSQPTQSLDKTPPPIPHITDNYITLKTIIANLVLFTHKEFRNIFETLPATTSDIAKKRRLLDFIVKIRTEFVKVYVLTKWARISKDISKTIDVVSWLNGQQYCFRNVVSALFGIEKALAGAKLRTPDIETALEVFTAGRPAQSSRNYFPVKKLDPSTILQTLHDLDILLSIRLALTEKLPLEFSHYKISDGRVTFFVENSYQVQLGIADDSVNARFFLVDFKFDFPGAFNISAKTKARLELISNEFLPKKGLVDFFAMLLKFTQNYKLSTYYASLNDLRRGLYADLILPKFSPEKSLVTVQYWLTSKSSFSASSSSVSLPSNINTTSNQASISGSTSSAISSNQGSRSSIHIGISKITNKIGVLWYRDNQLVINHGLEFGQSQETVESLLQRVASLHVQYIVHNVFLSLSKILEYSNTSTNVGKMSHVANHQSLSSGQASVASNFSLSISSKNCKAISTQKSIYLQQSRNDVASSPQSPSGITASTPNTPAHTSEPFKPSTNELYNTDPSNYEIVTMITPEKLKIRLNSTRFTIFSIDRLTGKAILTNSTHLVSSAEVAINEAQGRFATIAEILIKLRLSSIQEEICNKAKVTGWITKQNIHPSIVRNKFPINTRLIFFLRQPTWPDKWYLLVTLNTHGIPRWWITQMLFKDNSWYVLFSEEASIPNEELGKSYNYKMFVELDQFTISRIRTEALRKELDRCKIKYRLVQSTNTNSDLKNSHTDTLIDNEILNISSRTIFDSSDSLPIAMFDISSIIEGSKWADKAAYMRISDVNEEKGTVEVIVQGHTKNVFSIGIMPSDDPSIKFNPNTGMFSLFLTVSSSTFSLSSSISASNQENSQSLKTNSELLNLIVQKLSQIQTIVSHVSLLKSLSLDIVEASMSKITFEYGPGMKASILITPNVEHTKNKVFEHEPSISKKCDSDQQKGFDIKSAGFKIASCSNDYGFVFKLHENSPHKIVEPFLQKVINAEGLGSVVWILRKCLPLYLALQELQEGRSIQLSDTNRNTTSQRSSSRPFNPIMVFAHSLLDFVIQFYRPSGQVCIQLKLVQSNHRPLSVFVSEFFFRDQFYVPSISAPLTSEELDNQSNLLFAPLIPLWRQKSEIPGVIPLQQGLSCPIEKIGPVLMKITAIIAQPSSSLVQPVGTSLNIGNGSSGNGNNNAVRS
ncbi:uncharacterized protein SAPINGB_P003276 [Magnusiomyces paraingens]|uniref:Mediator of RNA polymerase II transcription subunit 14 n=1 Tax=Magnusiomyces paraingens TaxID=2606893 RepID=A0A5E8BJW2_9ASCO|nr:uncharacterized protein SAPINGB_P003276 [Saprochaete ingens]VVT51978.1 unnamed protein product [Saprochaete ingens]